MTYHILKNSGILPEEADLRKHIAALSKMIKTAENPEEVRELYQKLLHLQTKYNLLMEKRKNNIK